MAARTQYQYFKDIPAIIVYNLKRIVSTTESADPYGAWVELASSQFVNFSNNDVERIMAGGNNRIEWTNSFFNHWLLRRPTFTNVVRAFIEVSIHEAIDILEPLCTGEALQFVQEWRDRDEQRRLEQPPLSLPPSPTPLEDEYIPEEDNFVSRSYSEMPYGVEASALPISVSDNSIEMTSCLNGLAAAVETVSLPDELIQPVMQRQSAQDYAARSEQRALRVSWKAGQFAKQRSRQLQLVTNTDEARASATYLLDLYRRLSHPHLAPLLGFSDFSTSIDLHFPYYVCSLDDAYCHRGARKFDCPMDLDSRLRIVFGIAKALLYLHGNQRTGECFVLNNLNCRTVMLDSFWCPAICDLTEIRKVYDLSNSSEFSGDVRDFKMVSVEVLTSLCRHKDERLFNEAISCIEHMLTLKPADRTQFVFDNDDLMPDEMRPDESVIDTDESGDEERILADIYFRFQLILCLMILPEGVESIRDFADCMKSLSQRHNFSDLWLSF